MPTATARTTAQATTTPGLHRSPTMLAIVQDRDGSADILRIAEISTPVPTDHQVLVRVHAAGLNHADTALMRGEPLVLRLAFGVRCPKVRVRGVDVARAHGVDVPRCRARRPSLTPASRRRRSTAIGSDRVRGAARPVSRRVLAGHHRGVPSARFAGPREHDRRRRVVACPNAWHPDSRGFGRSAERTAAHRVERPSRPPPWSSTLGGYP